MSLAKKIKDLNKKGFEVRFKGMPSGNIYISIYGNYLQRATVCIKKEDLNMSLAKKIKDLNKKGFEVRFEGMPSGNIYISIYGNYLQRATVCIHSCQISHDDCGLDELFERSLGFVERDYLDFYSCENCARNKDYGGCPKSYLCFDTFTKLAFKEKEDVKKENN